MKLCRFLNQNQIRIGLWNEGGMISDLSAAGVMQLTPLLEREDLVAHLRSLAAQKLPEVSPSEVRLLPPIERQEVWAVGVTYLRSKKARMEESDFSATAYDKVYDAPRPELFFKSMPEKVVGTGDAVGIRRDATWNVPEPELALVLNSRGTVVGYTVGNDMSSRDIEGENLLYLPQAKIYDRAVRCWAVHRCWRERGSGTRLDDCGADFTRRPGGVLRSDFGVPDQTHVCRDGGLLVPLADVPAGRGAADGHGRGAGG